MIFGLIYYLRLLYLLPVESRHLHSRLEWLYLWFGVRSLPNSLVRHEQRVSHHSRFDWVHHVVHSRPPSVYVYLRWFFHRPFPWFRAAAFASYEHVLLFSLYNWFGGRLLQLLLVTLGVWREQIFERVSYPVWNRSLFWSIWFLLLSCLFWLWRRRLNNKRLQRLLFAGTFLHCGCRHLTLWPLLKKPLTSWPAIIVIKNLKPSWRWLLGLFMAAKRIILLFDFGGLHLPSLVIWDALPESVLIFYVFLFHLVFPKLLLFFLFLFFHFLNEVVLFDFLGHFFFYHFIDFLHLFFVIIIALLRLNDALLDIFFRVLNVILCLSQNHLSLLVVIKNPFLDIHLADRRLRDFHWCLHPNAILIRGRPSRLWPDLRWGLQLLRGLHMCNREYLIGVRRLISSLHHLSLYLFAVVRLEHSAKRGLTALCGRRRNSDGAVSGWFYQVVDILILFLDWFWQNWGLGPLHWSVSIHFWFYCVGVSNG